MKRPADGIKTELEKSADPDTRTEALLVEFCKGVANEGMPGRLDIDEEQQDPIDEPIWQRSLAPEGQEMHGRGNVVYWKTNRKIMNDLQGQEVHGMMNDEGNGDQQAVPMVLENIQFKGSQPQTAAEASKRLEEALRRGADTASIKTERGLMAHDVQMFAPSTMRKQDPQGRGAGWTAKAGMTHA